MCSFFFFFFLRERGGGGYKQRKIFCLLFLVCSIDCSTLQTTKCISGTDLLSFTLGLTDLEADDHAGHLPLLKHTETGQPVPALTQGTH